MEELENKTQGAGESVATEPANGTEQTGKYYTPEEIALIEQKAGDKRISQYQKTLDKKTKEAEKLSKMSTEERYAYDLEQREKALEEKEQALILAENKNAVSRILAEKGLSLSLVDFCVDVDAEKMNEKIKTLDKAFKASVKAEVEKRLGTGSVPKKGEQGTDELTKESFRKLSIKEQQEIYRQDPALYKSLIN